MELKEKVVYGTTGVCVVDSIEQKKIGRNIKQYYVLKPVAQSTSTVFLPVDNEELLAKLAANGQIAAQYVDENGEPSMLIWDNPNGSVAAVEAITSPDGRVLGKMGHSERIGADLYRNVPGNFDMQIFAAAVKYFRG